MLLRLFTFSGAAQLASAAQMGAGEWGICCGVCCADDLQAVPQVLPWSSTGAHDNASAQASHLSVLAADW